MRKTITGFALLAFLCSTANAQDFSAMAKEMTACDTNEECIVVEDICGDWTSVNKKAESAQAELVAKMRPLASCPVPTQTPKPAAECAEHHCEVK